MADKFPVTPAIRDLRAAGVEFLQHVYKYEEKGGTKASSKALGVSEHCVIKTLVMEDEAAKVLIVLMHGDAEVSTKNLARFLGSKTIKPCTPVRANQLTGYLVGGTSPFGLALPLPVYCEKSILDLERVYINGGKRGFLVSLKPSELSRVLSPVLVEVAV